MEGCQAAWEGCLALTRDGGGDRFMVNAYSRSGAQAGVSDWQLYGAPVRQFTNIQSIYKPYRATFGAYLPAPILYCSASYIFGRKKAIVDIVTPDRPFARCDRAVLVNCSQL